MPFYEILINRTLNKGTRSCWYCLVEGEDEQAVTEDYTINGYTIDFIRVVPLLLPEPEGRNDIHLETPLSSRHYDELLASVVPKEAKNKRVLDLQT